MTATDIEKAAEKDLTYEMVDGKVLIGQRIVTSKFYLIPPKSAPKGYEPDIDKIEQDLKNDPRLQRLENGDALVGVLKALHDGFMIEGDSTTPEQAGDPCPVGVHLVLRSLIGVMAPAAQEQAPFDELNQSNPLIKGKEQLTFDEAIPEIERLPILRINWRQDTEVKPTTQQPLLQPTSPLIELNYRGTEYLIADAREPLVPEDEYWNRDVFRLVGALTAQVTVDIS